MRRVVVFSFIAAVAISLITPDAWAGWRRRNACCCGAILRCDCVGACGTFWPGDCRYAYVLLTESGTYVASGYCTTCGNRWRCTWGCLAADSYQALVIGDASGMHQCCFSAGCAVNHGRCSPYVPPKYYDFTNYICTGGNCTGAYGKVWDGDGSYKYYLFNSNMQCKSNGNAPIAGGNWNATWPGVAVGEYTLIVHGDVSGNHGPYTVCEKCPPP